MKKELGQVFTPSDIVSKMITLSDYENNCIDKKVLEPSCGDGAFLVQIVEKLILSCKEKDFTDEEIVKQIANNIYAVEIDEVFYKKAIENVLKITDKYGLKDVDFNIYCQDTLLTPFTEKFDYIIGNPPYVKVKKDKYKDIKFLKGNTDMYIAFFSFCINLLNEDGKLCFITPNSYIKNSSQKEFRKYLLDEDLIRYIYNFESFKVFEGFDTYTAITLLQKNDSKILDYNTASISKQISYDSLELSWNFSENLGTNLLKNTCLFQHGFATNADKIFISKVNDFDKKLVTFNNVKIEKTLLRKVVKGNKYKGKFENTYIIFPYIKKDDKYVAIDEADLKTKYPKTYAYLLSKKEELEKRSLENNMPWYAFARSQSIQNIDKEKIVVNSCIEGTSTKLAFYKLDAGIGVYSGIYGCDYDNYANVEKILSSKEICEYALSSGKDMSGGYKAISAKILNEYKY